MDGDWVVSSLGVSVEYRLESLLLSAAGCCRGDWYLLAAHLVEGVLLLLNLDFLRLLVPTAQQFTKAVSSTRDKRRADSGGWTTETAQSCLEDPRAGQLVLQWLTGQAVATAPLFWQARLGPISQAGFQGGIRLVGIVDQGSQPPSLLSQASPDTPPNNCD